VRRPRSPHQRRPRRLPGLERIRQLVTEEGSASRGRGAVRAGTVFTPTRRPAGIDRFPREMMERYFRPSPTSAASASTTSWPWATSRGPGRLRLQHGGDGPPAGLDVQRRVEAPRPGQPEDVQRAVARRSGGRGADPGGHQRRARPDVGVAEMDELLNRYVLPEWPEADDTRWMHIADANDDEVWRVKEQGRQRLVASSAAASDSALARGVSESDVAWTGETSTPGADAGLRPAVRGLQAATLLLSQPERLKAFSRRGAAHPDRLRRQGPPRRRHRQGDDPPDHLLRPGPRDPQPGWPSSRTTTWSWPVGCIRAVTCG